VAAGVNFTINKVQLSVNADHKTKVYGDADPTPLTYSFTGFKNGQDASVVGGTAAISRLSGEDVATSLYLISVTNVSGLTATNYTFTSGTTAYLDITPKALTITATDQHKAFGATFTFTGHEFITSTMVGTQTVASCTIASGGAVASAAASLTPYDITISGAVAGPGTSLGNYDITYVKGKLLR